MSDLFYVYEPTTLRLDSVSDLASDTPTQYDYPSFNYDAKGNVTNNSKRGFMYNDANQMVQSGTYTYQYDGHNRRVVSTDSKGTSYSFYDLSGQLLLRETDQGITSYIFLGKKLIAKDKTFSEPEQPAQSSRVHHRPFGATVDPEKDDVGYTGHKFDTDLGLSYMQARYYDPVLGRFMSNDPVGYTAKNPVMSFNRYLYANNNPYKYTDPNGQFIKLAKALWNVGKKAWKNGGDFKKAGKEEFADIVENVAELVDGDLTLDDAFAAADLVTGFGGEAKDVYHRLGDAAGSIDSIKSSGKLLGNPATNTYASDIPKVKAYAGPIPDGKKGFEFTTAAKPDSGGKPGQPTWSGNGHNSSVQTVNDQAVINVEVTKVKN